MQTSDVVIYMSGYEKRDLIVQKLKLRYGA